MADAARDLIDEARTWGTLSPFIPGDIVIGDQTLSLRHASAASVYFDILNFGDRGKGHASALLDRLLRLADKHGVEIVGTAKPFGRVRGLNKTQLLSWYRRHGFSSRNDMIVYKPQKPQQEHKAKVSYAVSKPHPSNRETLKLGSRMREISISRSR